MSLLSPRKPYSSTSSPFDRELNLVPRFNGLRLSKGFYYLGGISSRSSASSINETLINYKIDRYEHDDCMGAVSLGSWVWGGLEGMFVEVVEAGLDILGLEGLIQDILLDLE